jgi:hypothetical protein
MKFVYYIDGKKYKIDAYSKIPHDKISSPDENTPAFEDLSTGEKLWCNEKDFWHRLTGPAYIEPNGSYYFYLNGEYYSNIKEWLKDHPNQTNAFQVEMLLKYG